MERLISVSAFGLFTDWACINEDFTFDVYCTIISSNTGILKDKYCLKLEGTETNIQMFVDYLKHKGFKIKQFE